MLDTPNGEVDVYGRRTMFPRDNTVLLSIVRPWASVKNFRQFALLTRRFAPAVRKKGNSRYNVASVEEDRVSPRPILTTMTDLLIARLEEIPAMPELPEVETMVRGIRATLEGAFIVEVADCDCRCRPILMSPTLPEMNSRAVGQTIVGVTRRAKRVVISLASGDAFVIEPRMTGLMLVADPPDPEHLRLRWSVTRGKRRLDIWFWDRRGLGTVQLLSPLEQPAILGSDRLGPDALEITVDQWCERLIRTSRPIKVALLDQKLVAGIGNLYASEILHRSRISPHSPADRLSRARIARMAAVVREVLEEAIRHEGSTLSDGTYRNALNKSGGYQNAHLVYDREGEACTSCRRAHIRRIVQAQRSTFYCPNCQRR